VGGETKVRCNKSPRFSEKSICFGEERRTYSCRAKKALAVNESPLGGTT
jgi:hypothetical protein